MAMTIELTVNGEPRAVETDRRRTLLDLLREELGLTGTKYGCGEGECGACTVLLDGKPVRSCTTPVSLARGKSVRTIEGLGAEGNLHIVQEAFIAEGAMQCGYCVPGMIMNAVGLLEDNPYATRPEIIEAMNGNLCRCCGYSRIVAAIERVVHQSQEAIL